MGLRLHPTVLFWPLCCCPSACSLAQLHLLLGIPDSSVGLTSNDADGGSVVLGEAGPVLRSQVLRPHKTTTAYGCDYVQSDQGTGAEWRTCPHGQCKGSQVTALLARLPHVPHICPPSVLGGALASPALVTLTLTSRLIRPGFCPEPFCTTSLYSQLTELKGFSAMCCVSGTVAFIIVFLLCVNQKHITSIHLRLVFMCRTYKSPAKLSLLMVYFYVLGKCKL